MTDQLDTLGDWLKSPATFVRQVFRASPDAWQVDVLEQFNGSQRQAMSACKGPGKTTVLAWLCWYFLATRPDAKVAVLSVTADTLADTLWRELATWYAQSPVLQDCFGMTATSIYHKQRPQTWRATARSYPRNANPQQQANALAGLHDPHLLFLLDEAGSHSASMLATAEAVLAGGGDQHIVMAGNPTDPQSALGIACIDHRRFWLCYEITGDPTDPKRSPRVSKEWAQGQIDSWGADNPWVLVNVFGKFPPSAINALLSADDVLAAQKRHYPESFYAAQPKVLGVDVARYGDDESVIFKRQGKVAFVPLRMRNLDSVQGASHVAKIFQEWQADSIQIDATGGYGSGWLDNLRAMNFSQALGVQFSGAASQPTRYANKRAEMYMALAEWVKDGGALPPVPEMVKGLSSMTYTFKGNLLILEDKAQIKARMGRSPDLEDALACSFAYPVAVQPKDVFNQPTEVGQHIAGHSYDPWQRFADEQRRQYG